MVSDAEYGIGVFSGAMLLDNSTMDIQVLDTGLYCLSEDITVNTSVIQCSKAWVGMYADYGNIIINGNSELNLENRLYGLRIYNGNLTVNGGIIHAVGNEGCGGISVLNEKGSKTELPTDSITLASELTEASGGKIATTEVIWDNGFDEPYPVFITTFIPGNNDRLNADLSNALTTVDINIKDADYTAVDEAIAKANELDKDIYKDLSAVKEAVNAVVRDKNITEQAEVDAMAKAINDAIFAAVKKNIATITDIADLSKIYDGKAVTITAEQYTYNGDGEVYITWYADNNGVKGEKIDAPTEIGTYWVGISAAMTDNYLAAEKIYKSFTINEKQPSPPTGDNRNIGLWMALLFVSGFGLIGTTALLTSRRKKQAR